MTEKKKAKKQPVHRRQFEKEVRIALEDPEEREGILKGMLGKMRDRDEVELEAKEVAVGYRKKLKDLDKQIESDRVNLDQGMPVQRLVEETRNFNASDKFPNGRLTIKDVETGVVYEDRPMTEDDAQIPISDLPNGDAGEDADDSDSAPGDDDDEDDRR
jgi:hypothetical protein